MSCFTTVTVSIDMAPYREQWRSYFTDPYRLAEREDFAELILADVLREQFFAIVEMTPRPLELHVMRPNITELVNRVHYPALWRGLAKTPFTKPNYTILDIHYRRAGERFIIRGTNE